MYESDLLYPSWLYSVSNFVYIHWTLLTLQAKGDKSQKLEMIFVNKYF